MKKLLVILLLLLLGLVCLFAQEKEQIKYENILQGKLKIGQASLTIVFKTYLKEDGSLGAFLDSPDQGALNIPVNKVEFKPDSIYFYSDAVKGTYKGKIEKDSFYVKGEWSQGGYSFPLDLKKIDKLTEAKRPQHPVKPYPYNEEEIVFENNSAGISLAGTLTYPKGGNNFPAVVLVTGSGGQDRDETIFNHKPFWVIADYLTRNGIAVLRFDDRGVGKSGGSQYNSTSIDFAGDAEAAVNYLKTRSEINKKRIGIIGHSEGGMIAPMTAANSNDVAFIVLLAGPGTIGKDLLLRQTELILRANGMAESEIEKNVKQAKDIYEIVLTEPDSSTAYKNLKEMFDKDVAVLSDEDKKKPEYSEENFNQQVRTILSPWFRFFLKYDPKPILENISIPVLALNGDKDLQVDAEQNLPGIEDALKSGGNKNFKIVKMHGLNHLFQNAQTGALAEYGSIEETFSEEALNIISEWIKELVK